MDLLNVCVWETDTAISSGLWVQGPAPTLIPTKMWKFSSFPPPRLKAVSQEQQRHRNSLREPSHCPALVWNLASELPFLAGVTDAELSQASLRSLQMDTWVGARAGWKLELSVVGYLLAWLWGQLQNSRSEHGCACPSTLWSPLNTAAAAEGTWGSTASRWSQATKNISFVFQQNPPLIKSPGLH